MAYKPENLMESNDGDNEHQGYMPEEKGPFRCDHCEYYASKGDCNNQIVIGWATKKLYGLSLLKNGDAKVDPGGCSDQYESKDEGDEDTEDTEDTEDNESPISKMDPGLPVKRPSSKLNFGG